MSEMPSCEAIVNELRDEALKYPDTGWLSDLARRDLRWDGQNEIIIIGSWYGSVDVGHLAAIVESLIDKKTQDLTTRLEQAEQDRVKLMNRLDAMRRQRDGYRNQLRKTEQQVARVREMHQQSVMYYAGYGYGCTGCMGTTYPCSTIRALDGDTRRLADQGLGGGQDG